MSRHRTRPAEAENVRKALENAGQALLAAHNAITEAQRAMRASAAAGRALVSTVSDRYMAECEWFIGCHKPPTEIVVHPVLKCVPTCAEHAEWVGEIMIAALHDDS